MLCQNCSYINSSLYMYSIFLYGKEEVLVLRLLLGLNLWDWRRQPDPSVVHCHLFYAAISQKESIMCHNLTTTPPWRNIMIRENTLKLWLDDLTRQKWVIMLPLPPDRDGWYPYPFCVNLIHSSIWHCGILPARGSISIGISCHKSNVLLIEWSSSTGRTYDLPSQ